MIVAHHAGEDNLILLLAGSGASTGSLLLVVWRTRLGRLVNWIRRR
jgi:hypothetical protein